jgi:hypothetical protein
VAYLQAIVVVADIIMKQNGHSNGPNLDALGRCGILRKPPSAEELAYDVWEAPPTEWASSSKYEGPTGFPWAASFNSFGIEEAMVLLALASVLASSKPMPWDSFSWCKRR